MERSSRAVEMNQESKKKRLLLSGYFSSMKDQDAKRTYLDKLPVIGGVDPWDREKGVERRRWLVA